MKSRFAKRVSSRNAKKIIIVVSEQGNLRASLFVFPSFRGVYFISITRKKDVTNKRNQKGAGRGPSWGGGDPPPAVLNTSCWQCTVLGLSEVVSSVLWSPYFPLPSLSEFLASTSFLCYQTLWGLGLFSGPGTFALRFCV